MLWFTTKHRFRWCLVKGGYVGLDVGTEFLGTVTNVKIHGLDGGVVFEIIVGGGAFCFDLLFGESESDEEKEEGG